MEEYKLTFLEAVRALEEKKCKAIESEFGPRYEIAACVLSHIEKGATGIKLSPGSFLGKWRFVDPKPVKRKKVIEGVDWRMSSESGVTYPIGCPVGYLGQTWSDFLHKPPMKMTLEWEE